MSTFPCMQVHRCFLRSHLRALRQRKGPPFDLIGPMPSPGTQVQRQRPPRSAAGCWTEKGACIAAGGAGTPWENEKSNLEKAYLCAFSSFVTETFPEQPHSRQYGSQDGKSTKGQRLRVDRLTSHHRSLVPVWQFSK